MKSNEIQDKRPAWFKEIKQTLILPFTSIDRKYAKECSVLVNQLNVLFFKSAKYEDIAKSENNITDNYYTKEFLSKLKNNYGIDAIISGDIIDYSVSYNSFYYDGMINNADQLRNDDRNKYMTFITKIQVEVIGTANGEKYRLSYDVPTGGLTDNALMNIAHSIFDDIYTMSGGKYPWDKQ